MAEVVNENQQTTQDEPQEETARERLDKTAATMQLSEMMKDVSDTINKVSNALTENPLYSTYIEFSINGLKVLNTSTNRSQNIAVSLINNKNGSGEANTFTLVIAHGPGFSPDFDANALEMAIMSNTALIAQRGPESLKCKLRYGYSEPFIRTCEYEGLLLNYTMDCQDGILIYTLTGYSGLSRYTESKEPLSLKDICVIEPTLDSLQMEENTESSEDTQEAVSADNPLSQGRGPISDKAASTNNNDCTEIWTSSLYKLGGSSLPDLNKKEEDVTPESADEDSSEEKPQAETPTVVSADRVKAQPTVAAYYIICTYLKEYNCIFGKIGDESVYASDVSVEMPMQVDKNPMKALTDILNMGVHVSQKQALEGTHSMKNEAKITYRWYVSDAPNKEDGRPTIYIVAEDPKEYKNAEASITFNWGAPVLKDGKLQSIVYSFKPKFEGSALIALWDSYRNTNEPTSGAEDTHESSEGNKTGTTDENNEEAAADGQQAGTDKVTGIGSFFVKDDGSIGFAQQATAPVAGGNTETVNANIEQLRSTWVSHVQYPYKADLSTVGIPCEIPIMGVINVNAIVGFNATKAKHHTSGKYQVITTEDVIDASGYRTNWNLAKLEEVTAEQLKDGGGLIENTITEGLTNDGVDADSPAEDETKSPLSFNPNLKYPPWNIAPNNAYTNTLQPGGLLTNPLIANNFGGAVKDE